jgi:glycosyltransferase involved in cell wall biosynthesis
MKITVLSHNLSSNAAMRAHRLALAARQFADVTLIGPVEKSGLWPALPNEGWIRTVPERRFPAFHRSFVELVRACEGDALIAVKPHLASYGVALVAAEQRQVPVILDHDDLDVAFSPPELWAKKKSTTDLKRPASAVFVSLLTKASSAAQAVTVASTALQQRFGGTLLPHGCLTDLFDPARIDREAARREFGFGGPTILFPGTPRRHKGLKPLAKAVRRIEGAKLAVFCRDKDLPESEWKGYPLLRLPLVPHTKMPEALAAADVLAIPQLDEEPARYQMPMKVYDCMAMARPIVATAVSDLPRVLEGCGRIVPPGESKPLRHAIRELLQDTDTARQLGQNARERCLRDYSLEKVSQILRGVVESAIAKA